MNGRNELIQAYDINVTPIPNTPQWYRVRFDPLEAPREAATDLAFAPAPEAIVAMQEEPSLVRWNEAPQDAILSRKVFEAEARHQVGVEHQKRLAI